MEIYEMFVKAEDEVVRKDISNTKAFSIGLSYMLGYGLVTGMEADEGTIYFETVEGLLGYPSIRHLVALGFHYDDGIAFYT